MTSSKLSVAAFALLMGALIDAKPAPTQLQPPSTPSSPPVVVQVQQPQKSAEEIAGEKEDREARNAKDRATLEVNRRLVTIGTWQLIVFGLQLVVFGYQAYMLRKTVDSANKQSQDMRDSIRESARAATALEALGTNVAASASAAADSVATMKERTALQLRAYVTALIGSGYFQDRDRHFKFGGCPTLLNSGNTPALNARHNAKAGIFAVPLPQDLVLPEVGRLPAGGVIAPHQTTTIGGIVDDYVPDNEVEEVKAGVNRAVYVWGRVVYEDVLGEEHTTEFCQQLIFTPDGKVTGFYVAGRNKIT